MFNIGCEFVKERYSKNESAEKDKKNIQLIEDT